MPNYIEGLPMPEPGRPIHRKKQSQPKINVNVDVNAIADAVINAINKKGISSKSNNEIISNTNTGDTFNTKESLSKIADAMIVSKDSKSNFDDLGEVKKVDRDINEVNKTIDLLKNID